jgi:hypothetical protein
MTNEHLRTSVPYTFNVSIMAATGVTYFQGFAQEVVESLLILLNQLKIFSIFFL